MIKYLYNEEDQFLDVTYEGTINAEDLIRHIKSIASNKDIPRKLKILTDARNASYNFDSTDLHKLDKHMSEALKSFILYKSAFIHSKPKETAFSFLMGVRQTSDVFMHKIFVTREAALKWLL